MPGFRDAEELERDTDRMIAERDAQAEADEHRRQEDERADREAKAQKLRDDTVRVVQSSASSIDGIDEQLAWWRAALRNWKERNRAFMNVTAAEVALFLLLMSSPFAVATLDFLMLSYVGREIARGAIESFKGIGGGSSGWIVLVAVLLFTLGYVAVELVIGAAGDNQRLTENVRRHAVQLAVMLWITLPLFIVIFSLVASGVFSADPNKPMGRATFTAAFARAALFGVFAMAIHGFMLRFGTAVVNSYGYWLFMTRRLYMERRIRGLVRRHRAAGGDLESNFRDFHGAVTSAGGTEAKVGPFGATTSRVVNATFGTDVIEMPQTEQQQSRPPETGAGRDRQYPPDGGSQAPHERRVHENPEANEPSQAQENGGEPKYEWPGTVYDMDGEDEIG